ncbi:MAG: tyrosine-type recombinase/integrase [Anaerolineae bacterium]|nr:tyrosine-type recombinase/integrase [Anaerolineae bacterium]
MAEKQAQTVAERYDRALRKGRKLSPVPEGCPVPQPTSSWPPENVALLEKYRSWLAEGGVAQSVIEQHRIPMAGHVLGLNLKPHPQLDISATTEQGFGADLQKAVAYIEAKQRSEGWTRNCRHSLTWFRRFLRLERGLVTAEEAATCGNAARYQEGLPGWLLTQLEKYLQLRQVNWRPSRRAVSTYQFWQKYTQIWRWLCQQKEVELDSIESVMTLRRRHLYAYIDEKLAQGYATSSINLDLYNFQGCLRFLQQRGCQVPAALLTLPGLKKPDSLPRFLTDEQVRRLRDDLEQQLTEATTTARIRMCRLDLAAFYLLWQGGLRLCELEDLTLADLSLDQQRIVIRRSKGVKDRTVYLTAATVKAVEAYLEMRGESIGGINEYVFLYRHKHISTELIRLRLKAAGKRTGVKVTPHMLRHTFATQLVNAGCKITSIQALLGHQRLQTTLTYARLHDQTVARDYYTAMAVIEERLQPRLPQAETPKPEDNGHNPAQTKTPTRLLQLVTTLQAEPLTDSQQAMVDELQQGLAALAKTAQGIPKPPDQRVVNEPAIPAW